MTRARSRSSDVLEASKLNVEKSGPEKRGAAEEMKLAEMFERAKELTQIRLEYGDAGRKRACARGAICYYLSDGRACEPYMLLPAERAEFHRLIEKWNDAGLPDIIDLNDEKGWSFKQFAKAAKEHGL